MGLPRRCVPRAVAGQSWCWRVRNRSALEERDKKGEWPVSRSLAPHALQPSFPVPGGLDGWVVP